MQRLEVDPIKLVGRLMHPDYIHMDFFSPGQLERADRLDSIPRWNAIQEMTHRPTVGAHSLKVLELSFLFSQMCMELGLELDQPLIVFMSEHHDDPEIADMEDIPAPVKRAANRAERRRMEKKERKDAERVEHLVDKPIGIPSYQKVFEDYKKQDTLEARIVKYADAWDGLHEAINEVVCGENKDRFRQVIEEYRPEFEDLNKKNRDWQRLVCMFMGDDFFEFPDARTMPSTQFEELDFSSCAALAGSISKNDRGSYFFWLSAAEQTFKLSFFDYVLPGWKNRLPRNVVSDIQRTQYLRDWILIKHLLKDSTPPKFDRYNETQGGVIIPLKEDEHTFAETLIVDGASETIFDIGRELRQTLGIRRARGKYYNIQPYLYGQARD